MKPSSSLYWTRAILGVTMGALDAFYDYAVGNITATHSISINDFFTGLAFALMFFIVTYYVLKIFYTDKFQKKSKIMTTGIGTYFILWIVVWVLLETIIRVS
jgi:hypothetical protein